MAKKPKSAEDIIYEIKDLLDDLELKINPEDSYDDESEDEDLDIDEEDICSSNGKAVQGCDEKRESKQDDRCRILACVYAVNKRTSTRCYGKRSF